MILILFAAKAANSARLFLQSARQGDFPASAFYRLLSQLISTTGQCIVQHRNDLGAADSSSGEAINVLHEVTGGVGISDGGEGLSHQMIDRSLILLGQILFQLVLRLEVVDASVAQRPKLDGLEDIVLQYELDLHLGGIQGFFINFLLFSMVGFGISSESIILVIGYSVNIVFISSTLQITRFLYSSSTMAFLCAIFSSISATSLNWVRQRTRL